MTQAPEDLAETPNLAFEPTRRPDDPLSEVLNIVHVRGETALVLAPDGPQTITFPEVAPSLFFVERGEVTLHVDDNPGVVLKPMQLALLLHRPAQEIRFKGGGERLSLAEVGASPDVRVGSPPGESESLRCFWGAFSFDGELAARVLRTLPPVIVLTDLEENPSQLLEMCCNLILMEMKAGQPGANVMVSRLLDLLLIQVLRRWAHSIEDAPSWLAAAQDDRIARAVGAIHREPARDWTNTQLAELAGMSRSSFVDRFAKVMGQQPGAYLRAWRLDRAAEALQHSGASIDSIADQVGYASQESFSRAFHARFDVSPSAWRFSRS